MPNAMPNQEHDREARIRECAYHLWESNGKPYGRDVEFWQRAREIIAREDADEDAMPPPVPAASPAPRRRKAPPAKKPAKAS